MRLVHLSDLHLGYRQYVRTTSTGTNQREADVADTFRRVIDRVIELAPDLVLFTGDIFHVVRPTNQAILTAETGIRRLAAALPRAKLVMIAGDHDTPKEASTSGILRLFSPLGVHVVDRAPERLMLDIATNGGDIPTITRVGVLAIPGARGQRTPFVPSSGVDYNILMFHGSFEGILPSQVIEAASSPWNYIAFGHYHVYREMMPNAFYAGSIDYTSTNTWGESLEERALGIPGKGFIERDLYTGRHMFHHVPGVRRLIDLAPIDGHLLSPADLMGKIREAVEAETIDDNIVRCRVLDVERSTLRDLDHKQIRDWRLRAMHFQIDSEKPERYGRELGISAGGQRSRQPLEALLRDYLTRRELPADVPRDEFVSAGMAYLERAAEMNPNPYGLPEEPTT